MDAHLASTARCVGRYYGVVMSIVYTKDIRFNYSSFDLLLEVKNLSQEKKQSADYENFGHKTKNVSFWITGDTLHNWDVFADSKGMNRTELIKRAVDTYMDSKKGINGTDRIQDLEAKLTEKISLLDMKLEKHCIDFKAIMNSLYLEQLVC
jgi:hypothetical protein